MKRDSNKDDIFNYTNYEAMPALPTEAQRNKVIVSLLIHSLTEMIPLTDVNEIKFRIGIALNGAISLAETGRLPPPGDAARRLLEIRERIKNKK